MAEFSKQMTPPGGQIIQAARPGGQIFNKCKWHHLVAYFHQLQVVSHGGRILMKYKNLELIQVAQPGGQI